MSVLKPNEREAYGISCPNCRLQKSRERKLANGCSKVVFDMKGEFTQMMISELFD